MLNFKNTPHVQALLLLLIAMISVQSSGSLAKILFDQFPILTVAAMRLLLGSIILALIFKIWQINFRQVKWKAIISYGIALAGMNAMFYLSINRLPLALPFLLNSLVHSASRCITHDKNSILSGLDWPYLA